VTPLEIHPSVEFDLAEAVDYYAERDDRLGNQFLAQFHKALDTIQAWPHVGSLFGGRRHLTLRQFPYMVIYRVGPHKVYISAVVHARRDPKWIQAVVKGRRS
jgi:plasmid stabilization system protein ParE